MKYIVEVETPLKAEELKDVLNDYSFDIDVTKIPEGDELDIEVKKFIKALKYWESANNPKKYASVMRGLLMLAPNHKDVIGIFSNMFQNNQEEFESRLEQCRNVLKRN